MSKRKQSTDKDTELSDNSSDDDDSFIDVDFEFYDPNPAVDYHAFQRLLRQLFQHDAEMFHLNDLVDLILSQPTVGTTIKTDGIESDPYAVLTVLNMHVHHEHPSIKAVANYCLAKAVADPALHSTLNTLFSQTTHHVGLVLCERLINMPVQVIPPMYKMLADEVRWALADNEPYKFSHLLFLTRVYHLTPDEESALFNSSHPSTLKNKGKTAKKARPALEPQGPAPSQDGIYFFHPEDETIKNASIHTFDFAFSNSPPEPRGKDSFGLDVRGRMMIVPAERFEELVRRMGELYIVPQ